MRVLPLWVEEILAEIKSLMDESDLGVFSARATPLLTAVALALRAEVASKKALVTTWRDASDHEMHEMGNTQYAQALDQCADELEATLAPDWSHLASSPRTGSSE